MATDVLMPQMGESIAEGTVSRWIKNVGDKVERDEPLLEISTDKVDAEIPAPASGTLAEILVKEGETVAVNSVVARIAAEGAAAAPTPPPVAKPEAPPQPSAGGTPASPPKPPAEDENVASLEERRRTKSSPLVRKIARENNIDIAQLQGTGISGRVTKNDILDYIQQPSGGEAPSPVQPSAPAPRTGEAPVFQKPAGEAIRLEPL